MSGPWNHVARPEVLEVVPMSVKRVLDIGCGSGELGEALRERQQAEVTGIEPSPAAAIAVEKLHRVLQCTLVDAVDRLQEERFDCIILADVLEHLSDPLGSLTLLRGLLTPDGVFVVALPNVQNWPVLRDLLQGRWCRSSDGILDDTHVRFFTRSGIEELFWNAGLTIERVTEKFGGEEPPANLEAVVEQLGLPPNNVKGQARVFQYLVVARTPSPARDDEIVTAVVLNWNGRENTLSCLRSLRNIRAKNLRVIVADNGSTDGSPEAISQEFPECRVLQNGGNLGYAAGNNRAITAALSDGADLVWILNNDTVVESESLEELLKVHRVIPDAGSLSSKILWLDAPHSLWFAGARWEGKTFEIVGWRKDEGRIEFNSIRETESAIGCSMLLTRQALERVGLFDERFFLCFEESDWSFRARSAGYRNIYVPRSRVMHKGAASFGPGDSPLLAYFLMRNRLLWGEKHLSSRLRRRMWKRTYWEVAALLGEKKRELGMLGVVQDPLVRAKGRAIFDYLIRRFGDCPPGIRWLVGG
jgi:GT2 family glycosyltransferase/SAM-dependent methyltransferase